MLLPGDDKRHVLIGRTGSGKTQAGAHALSLRSIDSRPWVVINYKEDDLLNDIPHAVHLDHKLPVKMKSGIYVMHLFPDDHETIETIFSDVWNRRNIGVFVDEGYMVQKSPQSPNRWFRRLLTQGRSLSTPLIVGTQKPVWMDSFVFSESEYFQVFDLDDRENLSTIFRMTGQSLDMDRLPPYHSYWYSKPEKRLSILRPVPDRDTILATFEDRLGNQTKRTIFV